MSPQWILAEQTVQGAELGSLQGLCPGSGSLGSTMEAPTSCLPVPPNVTNHTGSKASGWWGGRELVSSLVPAFQPCPLLHAAFSGLGTLGGLSSVQQAEPMRVVPHRADGFWEPLTELLNLSVWFSSWEQRHVPWVIAQVWRRVGCRMRYGSTSST